METLGIWLGFGLPLSIFAPAESLLGLLLVACLEWKRRKKEKKSRSRWVYVLFGIGSGILLSKNMMSCIEWGAAWPWCLVWLVFLAGYGQKKERGYYAMGEEAMTSFLRHLLWIFMAILFVAQVPIGRNIPWDNASVSIGKIVFFFLIFWMMQLPFGASWDVYLLFGGSIACLASALPKEYLSMASGVFLQLGRTGGNEAFSLPRLEIPAAFVFWTALFLTLRGCIRNVRKGGEV